MHQVKVLFAFSSLLALFFVQTAVFSRDPVIAHYYLNDLYLNPATAGLHDKRTLVLNYRNQWPDLDANFVTYSASYDQPLDIAHGGFGVHLMNDAQGKNLYRRFSGNVMYAYHLEINQFTQLNAGFQAGWIQKSIQTAQLNFPDMYKKGDGFVKANTEALPGRNQGWGDFSFGMLLKWEDYRRDAYYVIGTAAHHLAQLETGTGHIDIPGKYSVHFSSRFPLYYSRFGEELISLKPRVLYNYQNKRHLFDYGAALAFGKYFLGASFRHQLKFDIEMLNIQIGLSASQYQFHYSYDMLFAGNTINVSSLGAHEATVMISFSSANK